MDVARLSFGERVAVAGAVALVIFMLLPWYEEDTGLGPRNLSAWQALGLIDVLLLLIALTVIGLVLARAAGALPPNLPVPPATTMAGAGALAALLVLYRLLELPSPDIPDADIGRKIGVYLGLLASLGIAFGGFTAMSERAARRGGRGRARR